MEVLRYLVPHLLAGCIGGLAAAWGLIATNLGSLRDLMMNSPDGWLAAALLSFGFAVTFGSAAIGAAIMQIDSDRR
ncbi:MAG TPA: hypothetical protein VGI78_15795 [Acetobacteraceae bacterium]|jgi:hypothetical protein